MYLLTCQVAYQCHSLGQAEASLEAILTLLNDLKDTKTEELNNIGHHFIPNFMSYMLVVPTSKNSLSLAKIMKATLGAVTNMYGNMSSPTDQLSLALLYVKAMELLCSAIVHHTKYPYHIGKFESRAEKLSLLLILLQICSICLRGTMCDFENCTQQL